MTRIDTEQTLSGERLVSLEDVKRLIEQDDSLQKTRKRDLLSALNAVNGWFGLPLANLPAARKPLREEFSILTPASVGVSRGRFDNVRSQLNRALDYVQAPIVRKIQPISRQWGQLLKSIDRAGDRNSFSKFARFCSALDLEPEQVNENTSAQYLLELENGSFVSKPRQKHQAFCRAWNRLVEKHRSSHNLARLEVPKYADRFGIPRDQFPSSFSREMEDYRQFLTDENILADKCSDMPVRAVTADYRVKQLYSAASALVRQGFDINDLTSLTVLVSIDNVELILRYFFERHGGKKTKVLSDNCEGLFKVSYRFLQLDAGHLDKLRSFKRKTKTKQFGMTMKNREVLRHFNDPLLVDALKRLPALEFKRIDGALMHYKRKRDSAICPNKLAIAYQKALAILILQNAPMRIKNLAGLNLKRHLNWNLVRGEVQILIPGDEVKNGEELHFCLGKTISNELKRYIEVYRPALLYGENTYLFPGQNGKHKSENNLSQQLAKLTHEKIGIRIHGHLFRHVMGKIFLDARPGAYEVLRRVLGHKSIETTKEYYTGEETRSALNMYHQALKCGLSESKK